jgi:hypothetical protein
MKATSGILEPHNADEAILSKAHWVDIDVALNGIRHLCPAGLPKRYQHSLASCRAEECVLEGVGIAGYAPKAAGGSSNDKRFAVCISPDDDSASMDEIAFDRRSPCHVVWDQRADGSWQSNIYVRNHILRQIVELFVTKRIHNIRLSIQVSILRDQLDRLAFSSKRVPPPSVPDRLSDRRVHSRLMSVFAS